jgi:hypothetical protein
MYYVIKEGPNYVADMCDTGAWGMTLQQNEAMEFSSATGAVQAILESLANHFARQGRLKHFVWGSVDQIEIVEVNDSKIEAYPERQV